MNDIATSAIETVQIQDSPAGNELSPLDLFRVDAYALLGSLLAQAPTEELLSWLQSIELIDDPQSSMREAWSVLQMAAGRADPDQVSDEYHQLFIGIGRGELLPYGSWYLTGFLMEKPLVELRNDLDALGIERDPEVREPEDHIAALCQVMAMLVSPDQNGGDQGPAQQFFERHLATWWRRFSQDLQHSQTAHFYSAVGRFAELFFEQEALLFSRR
ncbi:TorD/DmsD family molecular chaperone [Motiliproteus coralliicola]|uniref:TorD/DmsD family molecular chaperone n=1 Tax=Motiliproteus coralliicola TaxID=2283196 RepID=UPI001A9D3D1A|nr:molecular chaperone TorD family protein [Motiliproteus coralliicola]